MSLKPRSIANSPKKIQIVDTHETPKNRFCIDSPVDTPQFNRTLVIEHKEPTEQTHLTSVIAGIGHDPVAVLAKADSVPIGNLLDSETDEARRLGVFGSPTFAVGEEIFWGDDRLEIALKWWNEKK